MKSFESKFYDDNAKSIQQCIFIRFAYGSNIVVFKKRHQSNKYDINNKYFLDHYISVIFINIIFLIYAHKIKSSYLENVTFEIFTLEF